MIEYDPKRFKGERLKHQEEGVRFLLGYPYRALFDEMGVGKTKQVIDAATCLFEANLIRCVVVICPAAVRSVWDDPEDGEIAKWSLHPAHVSRYDKTTWNPLFTDGDKLRWIVTNYEFLRSGNRLKPFIKLVTAQKPFLLVLDESSRIKSRRAEQTRAVDKIAALAARRVLLDGTPYANSYMDLWSPLTTMDPKSVHDMNFWAFRAKYAIMGGWQFKQVIGYHEDEIRKLNTHLKKWVLRREKKDCLDLPDKLYSRLEVPLSAETFSIYRQMRDDMVVWAENGNPDSIAAHGAVKALRLAQICSGYLGGIIDDDGVELEEAREISREKLDAFLDWQKDHPERMIVWCRFNPEQRRALLALQNERGRKVFVVIGGQSAKNRDAQKKQWAETPGAVLVGQPQAGGWGLNLQTAHTVVYLSNDYNLVTRLQSEDRAHRKGQHENVTYIDFLATTPKGFHTVDHVILKALQKKENLASWTYSQWQRVLQERKPSGYKTSQEGVDQDDAPKV